MTRIVPLSFSLFPLPRDVGGYPTRDGRRVAWGKLLIRPGDVGLTRLEAHQLQHHGIVTHLELRFSDDGIPFPPPIVHLHGAQPVVIESTYPDEDRETLHSFPLIDAEKAVIKHLIMAITDAPSGAILISGSHVEYLEWLSVMIMGLLGVTDHALIEHTAMQDVALMRIQAGWDDAPLANPWNHAILALSAVRQEYHTFDAYAKVIGLSRLDLIRLKARLLED